eukprot:403294-Pyramimonas_sp.AAC.1
MASRGQNGSSAARVLLRSTHGKGHSKQGPSSPSSHRPRAPSSRGGRRRSWQWLRARMRRSS